MNISSSPALSQVNMPRQPRFGMAKYVLTVSGKRKAVDQFPVDKIAHAAAKEPDVIIKIKERSGKPGLFSWVWSGATSLVRRSSGGPNDIVMKKVKIKTPDNPLHREGIAASTTEVDHRIEDVVHSSQPTSSKNGLSVCLQRGLRNGPLTRSWKTLVQEPPSSSLLKRLAQRFRRGKRRTA